MTGTEARRQKKTYDNDLNHANKNGTQGSNFDGKVRCKLADKNPDDHANCDPESQVGVLFQEIVQDQCWAFYGLPGIVEPASNARGCPSSGSVSCWLFGTDGRAKASRFSAAHHFIWWSIGRCWYPRTSKRMVWPASVLWDGAEARKCAWASEWDGMKGKGKGRAGVNATVKKGRGKKGGRGGRRKEQIKWAMQKEK